MRFDDRLKTLLDAPVADARDQAVRWRQLVDLLSRLAPDDGGEAVEHALELVRGEAFAIDEQVRAATVRGIAGRSIGMPLLRILAAQPVRIAAPLFAGLALSHDDAALILANADAEVRALVAVAPAPAPVTKFPADEPLANSPEPAPPSIGDMVDRIERLRSQRARTAPPPPMARRQARAATSDGEPRLFEWESDASGHIAWVEGAPRGALVGRPLGGDGVGLLERQATARIEQRHPFVDVPLAIGEALAGDWSATGVPAFDPGNGRFLGYRGLARRLDGPPATPAPASGKETDLDALRETVHEIKTPLNAIIGFAEIIDGQYLGPAHRKYRERAAQIVSQARLLLDAVEDLDFAARLRAERGAAGPGSRLADLFPPIAADLNRCMLDSGGVLDVDLEDQRHRCALSPALAERLLRRLLLSLCQHVQPGEHFRIAVSRAGASCLLMIARPRCLDGISEAQLLDPAFDPRESKDSSTIGLGFALRLVRGLTRVAGGDLMIDDHRITLHLPALD
ncbi:MAG: hypothetical protein M3Q83_04110 [Pseudomonadota bacterium]|nr:hypothetical protein [Pseudomonadota bacterium]